MTKPKTTPKTTLITDSEEAAIQAGIAKDPDNPEWTREEFARARPFAEEFPKLAASLTRSGGQQEEPAKILVSLRLSRDILDYFKAGGLDWQARIEDLLRKAMADR